MKNQPPLPQSAHVPASDYIIIGGTGDLALRKIFPALLERFKAGQITPAFRLYVVSRHDLDRERFKKMLTPHLGKAEATDGFLDLIEMVKVDLSVENSMEILAEKLLPKSAPDRPMIFYLSITPSLFSSACKRLSEANLVLPQSRLVVEKPLGHDQASAEKINEELLSIFTESQIYRIDHYLGKETVQNLMALRFANVIFEALWNNRYIDHVQITVAETIGVGNRVGYYDQYGTIRDMFQNHLLQLLCLVAMEPPARFNADQVRNEKLRVLQAIRPIEPGDVIIGQYEGYQDEAGKKTKTETYAAVKLLIDNWRWAGVAFYMRTGKKLKFQASEIVITFKNRPHDIFAKDGITDGSMEIPNRLIIRVQPDEGLRLMLMSKEPGPGGMRLFPSALNLSFDETFNQRLPEAYERLLMDIARGNQTLFMRLDEVLAAWSIIDPIVAAQSVLNPKIYSTGTMGPADTLLSKDRLEWFDPKEDDDAT